MPRTLPRLKKGARARPRVRHRKIQEPQLSTADSSKQPTYPDNFQLDNHDSDSSATNSISDDFMEVEYLDEVLEEMAWDIPEKLSENGDTNNEYAEKKSESANARLKSDLAGWVSKYNFPLAGVSDK